MAVQDAGYEQLRECLTTAWDYVQVELNGADVLGHRLDVTDPRLTQTVEDGRIRYELTLTGSDPDIDAGPGNEVEINGTAIFPVSSGGSVYSRSTFQSVTMVAPEDVLRIIHDVYLPGASVDGVIDITTFGAEPCPADSSAAIAAADAAAQAAGDWAIRIPPGVWCVDQDTTIVSRILSYGVLLPGAGATLQIDGPINQYGKKALGLDNGGTIVMGPTSGQELDARFFACLPGLGVECETEVAAAMNDVFQVMRDSAIQSPRWNPVVYFPPGDYHIADSIWAGYSPIDADQRVYVFKAWGVRLIATPGLSDRIVFDMTGARRAKLLGLEIRTEGGFATSPRIGMMHARPVGGQSVGFGYFEGVRVDGMFKACALLKYASEVDRFNACEFRNANTQTPSFAIVSQAQASPVDPTSEHTPVFMGTTTNIDHFFYGCAITATWPGPDFNNGGCVQLAGAQRTSFHQCYFDQSQGNVEGMTAIRIGGNNNTALSVLDCHFHRNSWGGYIVLSGLLQELEFRGSGNSVGAQGAIVRMLDNAVLQDVYLRASIIGLLPNRRMIDGRAPGCNVNGAVIIGDYRTDISGEFSGRIETPGGLDNVGLTGPAAVVKARVVDQNAQMQRLVNTSDYPHRTVNANTTLLLSDMNGSVFRGGTGGSPITVTIPDPDPFPAGTVIEFANGVGVAGGNMILTHASDPTLLRFFTGTGDVLSGDLSIPRGYAVRAFRRTSNIWDIVPFSTWVT